MNAFHNDKYATDEEINNLIEHVPTILKNIDDMFLQLSYIPNLSKYKYCNPIYTSNFFNHFILSSKKLSPIVDKFVYCQSFPVYKTFINNKIYMNWLCKCKPLISSIIEWELMEDDIKRTTVIYYNSIKLSYVKYYFQFVFNKFNWFIKFEKYIKNLYEVLPYKKPENLRIIGKMKQFDTWVPVYETDDDFFGGMKKYNIK